MSSSIWTEGARMQAEGTAIVTGAGSGLGRAVAVELARRGFRVLAGAREPADVEPFSTGIGQVELVQRDVRSPGALAVPMDTCVLVNNAGLRLQYLAVEEVPVEEAQEIFEVNFHGVLRMVQQAVPAMRRNGGGVVCSITSTAVLSAMPFHGVYRASKAAVSSLSETLRLELAPFGICVIEIPLGPVDTPMYATSILARPIEARDSAMYRGTSPGVCRMCSAATQSRPPRPISLPLSSSTRSSQTAVRSVGRAIQLLDASRTRPARPLSRRT